MKGITNLSFAAYLQQNSLWPSSGRHILAQFDDHSIVVYQAYKPAIADFVLTNGYFGGEFKAKRMTWIKTNFLWMMFRCGWASKLNQERVLAIRLSRKTFDEILLRSVPSTFQPGRYQSEKEWQSDIDRSDVRLQWDPDHLPDGSRSPRKAIQLGLRRQAAKDYANEWILSVEDITQYVKTQAANAIYPYKELVTPAECLYPVNEDIANLINLSQCNESKD